MIPHHTLQSGRTISARALMVAFAAAALVAAPHTGAAQSGRVESANFAPSLHVNLDSMLRRPSGLYSQELAVGSGVAAIRGRSVLVRYTGWLPDGTIFDGGDDSSEITVTLGSNATIKGWEEGLLGMRAGGKRRLIVPSSLGYGAKGSGPIPPNSVLIFEISVVQVREDR